MTILPSLPVIKPSFNIPTKEGHTVSLLENLPHAFLKLFPALFNEY